MRLKEVVIVVSFLTAIAVIAAAWWFLFPPSGPSANYPELGDDSATGGLLPVVSETEVQRHTDGLRIALAATAKRISALEKSSSELGRRLAEVETPPKLQSVDLDRRSLVPGPSAYQRSKQVNRTASGISRRALDAYVRETGIDPVEIERLMGQ